jgi:hypothetical protein
MHRGCDAAVRRRQRAGCTPAWRSPMASRCPSRSPRFLRHRTVRIAALPPCDRVVVGFRANQCTVDDPDCLPDVTLGADMYWIT